MDSFVYLEILRSSKNFATPGKRTRKGFFARMHSNVIDQLVFGFKRSAFAGTILPKAGMIGHFGASDMFNSQMSDNFMQRAKNFVARFPGWGRS